MKTETKIQKRKNAFVAVFNATEEFRPVSGFECYKETQANAWAWANWAGEAARSIGFSTPDPIGWAAGLYSAPSAEEAFSALIGGEW